MFSRSVPARAGHDSCADQSPDVPMRVTGQVFVDASHKPCKDGKGLSFLLLARLFPPQLQQF